MQYKATIYFDTGPISKVFPSSVEAARWLDSENNNLENTTTIEAYDNEGNKTDGYFYTEKKK